MEVDINSTIVENTITSSSTGVQITAGSASATVNESTVSVTLSTPVTQAPVSQTIIEAKLNTNPVQVDIFAPPSADLTPYVKRDSSNMPIADSFAVSSLNTELRQLYDEGGSVAMEYGTGASYGVFFPLALQTANIFGTGSYIDFGSGGDGAILTRALVDFNGIDSVDPKSRYLLNSSSSVVFDYANSILYDPNSGLTVAQWDGFGGFLVLPSGLAADTIWTVAGAATISPLNRQLIDSYSVAAIDWESKIAEGAWNFTGDLTANNLSGTNTGDQNLSGFQRFTYFI